MTLRAGSTLWTRLLFRPQRTTKLALTLRQALRTPLSPSKRKRKNRDKYRSNKRAANEESIASSAQELTSILIESVEVQKEQAYHEKERQAYVYGHQAFLMPFVSAFNSMPLHVAKEASLKITEVVHASLQSSCMNLSTSTVHHSASAGLSTSGCSTPCPSTPLNTESNSEDFNITFLHPVTEWLIFPLLWLCYLYIYICVYYYFHWCCMTESFTWCIFS